MRIILGITAITLIAGAVFFALQLEQNDDLTVASNNTAAAPWIMADSLTPAQNDKPINYIIDISVASIEELNDLLTRAENLASKPSPGGAPPGIALILHGPEIEFFNIDNYDTYKTIVDRAARLDAFNIIDIRMCETMMDNIKVDPDKIPAFIELVPFAPTEIERLKNEGAVVL